MVGREREKRKERVLLGIWLSLASGRSGKVNLTLEDLRGERQ
jgi:hypothetical protein